MRVLWPLPLLALLGCVESDLCARTPSCENNRASNCDYTCAGCTGTPDLRDCGEAQCRVVAGDPSSAQFFRARAICVAAQTDACDPRSSPPPSCTDGVIRGCSAYRVVAEASCARADRYFTQTACCTQSATDGGVRDAGVGDAGVRDAGR